MVASVSLPRILLAASFLGLASGFAPSTVTVPLVPATSGKTLSTARCRGSFPASGRSSFLLGAADYSNGSSDDDGGNNSDGDDHDFDDDKMVSDFFFNISKNNMDARSSMDAGIYEMLGSSAAGAGDAATDRNNAEAPPATGTTVVVVDWECLLDALPYHIELGIHAARTVWPHLNDLCNFDTDREWLENKLFAMSHVLGRPEGTDETRHVACEFALATRLILEEQALDRNESTGKNGRYARKFHPRSEINGNDKFEEESRSRRPLTAGELAVNWREFIRSTLVVRYARDGAGNLREKEPVLELEEAIESYLSGGGKRRGTEGSGGGTSDDDDDDDDDESAAAAAATGNESSPAATKTRTDKSLPLFPQTKFALVNSATKLVVRINHKFDNDIVAKSLNQQLRLLPHERIAKTYKPENAIRRLFLNEDRNMVLLLRPDYKYDFFQGTTGGGGGNNHRSGPAAGVEETCLRNIMKSTHKCDNTRAAKQREKEPATPSSSSTTAPCTTASPTTPSVVWVDSSWHRLQSLAPVFGDTIPGGKNNKKNTARCSVAEDSDDDDDGVDETGGVGSDENENDAPGVWLSLYLAEWPAKETTTIASSENHEAAMVYPWTDSLSWDDAEDILIPSTWGSSDTAFQ